VEGGEDVVGKNEGSLVPLPRMARNLTQGVRGETLERRGGNAKEISSILILLARFPKFPIPVAGVGKSCAVRFRGKRPWKDRTPGVGE